MLCLCTVIVPRSGPVRLAGYQTNLHNGSQSCITARAVLLNEQFDIITMRLISSVFLLLMAGIANAGDNEEGYNEYTIRPGAVPIDAPKFDSFPATVYDGPNAKLNLRSDTETRLFRTQLARWGKEQPNFAGHYILARWGCGTNCYSISIIDAKTGRIYHPAGLRSNTTDNIDDALVEKSLQFKTDSKLLVLIGAPEEDMRRRGISYYVWEHNKMKRIKFIHKPLYSEK